jgi:hypothetical protein
MIFHVMLNFVMIICVIIFWDHFDDTVVMLSSNPLWCCFFSLSDALFLQLTLSAGDKVDLYVDDMPLICIKENGVSLFGFLIF